MFKLGDRVKVICTCTICIDNGSNGRVATIVKVPIEGRDYELDSLGMYTDSLFVLVEDTPLPIKVQPLPLPG